MTTRKYQVGREPVCHISHALQRGGDGGEDSGGDKGCGGDCDDDPAVCGVSDLPRDSCSRPIAPGTPSIVVYTISNSIFTRPLICWKTIPPRPTTISPRSLITVRIPVVFTHEPALPHQLGVCMARGGGLDRESYRFLYRPADTSRCQLTNDFGGHLGCGCWSRQRRDDPGDDGLPIILGQDSRPGGLVGERPDPR